MLASVEAPVLIDFWLENFRLQVGARSGELRLDVQGVLFVSTFVASS